MRNNDVLGSGYVQVFMYSGECVCNVVVFSGIVLNSIVEGDEKVLPSPQLLAAWCSLLARKQ